MKIMLVSPYLPARDGIAGYSSRLVESLHDAGHDVAVVTPRPHTDSPAVVLGGLAGGAAGRVLEMRVAEWAPDVVHVQFGVGAFGTRTALLLRWLRRLASSPSRPVLVLTMHEVTRDTALLGRAGRVLYRWLAERSDGIIVHTNTSRAALADIAGPAVASRVVVVPHPSSPPPPAGTSPSALRRKHGLPDDCPILLAFGFIHVDKGLGDLVEAVARLKAGSRSDARLVVAGTVRPRRGLFRLFELWDRIHLVGVRRLVRRRGLTDQVVWTDFVPDGEVRPWFAAADVVVLAYRRNEESGVAGIAAALQVPTLNSRVGGLAEAAPDLRWTFPPRDPAALADVMADFVTASEDERRTAVPTARVETKPVEVTRRTVDCYDAARARRADERDVRA